MKTLAFFLFCFVLGLAGCGTLFSDALCEGDNECNPGYLCQAGFCVETFFDVAGDIDIASDSQSEDVHDSENNDKDVFEADLDANGDTSDISDPCTLNEKKCAGEVKYQVCVEMGDTTEWGEPVQCQTGQKCHGWGECYCPVQCALNERRCPSDISKFELCQADGVCQKWQQYECPSGYLCTNPFGYCQKAIGFSPSGSEMVKPVVGALNGGGFMVVWVEKSDIKKIFGQIYDSSAAKKGSSFHFEGGDGWAGDSPAITTLKNNNLVITWERNGSGYRTISYNLLNATTFTLGTMETAGSFTTADAGYPSIAPLDNGGFVIVYKRIIDAISGTPPTYQIYFSLFNGQGWPIRTDVQFNEGIPDVSADLAAPNQFRRTAIVVPAQYGFLISWVESTLVNANKHYVQRYYFNGGSIGGLLNIANGQSIWWNDNPADLMNHRLYTGIRLSNDFNIVTWKRNDPDYNNCASLLSSDYTDNSSPTAGFGFGFYPVLIELSRNNLLTFRTYGANIYDMVPVARKIILNGTVLTSDWIISASTPASYTYGVKLAGDSFVIVWQYNDPNDDRSSIVGIHYR